LNRKIRSFRNSIFSGKSGPLIVLAHGAGAPMDSDAMSALADALVTAGARVMRFEFPYMQKTREDGRRRPPDREPALLAAWEDAIIFAREKMPGIPLFIGGKSMGGRMATRLLASESGAEQVAGCLCFGYPFHPPGKLDRWRTDHFQDLSVPLWVAQGERDPFGKRAEVTAHLDGAGGPDIYWVPDADHDLKPARRSGLSWEGVLAEMASDALNFMARCCPETTP